MRLPTDFELLSAVYEQVLPIFPKFDRSNPDRTAKIFVPLDLASIAKKLGVDIDIVFGRLYYDLENRHGYKKDGDLMVNFFAANLGQDRNCINVPLLSSVLADLQEQHRRVSISLRVSIAAFIVSLLSLGIGGGFQVYRAIQPDTPPQQGQPQPAQSPQTK
jgi:hypothetical protein